MASDAGGDLSVRDQGPVVSIIPAIPSPQSSAEPPERSQGNTLDTPQDQNGTSSSQRPSNSMSPGSRPRLQGNASSSSFRLARPKMWIPREYHKWKSPLLMFTFYLIGLGISIGHCAFYPSLKDKIVGSSRKQESNIR